MEFERLENENKELKEAVTAVENAMHTTLLIFRDEVKETVEYLEDSL